MGRRNRRYRKSPHEPIVIIQNRQQPRKAKSRCAYCGRLLDEGEYYWFPDEFGQWVRKCKNERYCSAHRKDTAETSFRRAIKRR